ncbi:MAG: zinc ribbon domain-containing protein [Thermoplasmata archaeon]|jgi:hypothetical protein
MQAYGETYPRTAYLLSLIGGIMILLFSIIYAIILAALASLVASVGFALGASLLIGLAVVAIIFGLIVLYFAMKLKSNPRSAKTYGILIIVFSLISFIGGGGFYIGAILALVGGILALVWNPPAQAPGYGQPMMPGAPGWGQPTMAAAPPAGAAGQRFCSSCGSPNATGAQFCAKCGAPMPP